MKRSNALYPISLTAIGFVSIQLFTLVLASDQRQEAVKSAPATVFMVTNVNNNGPGSLAQAILDANANLGADTITFSIGTGAQTINLTSALPSVSGPVTIDGTTQPGFSGAPLGQRAVWDSTDRHPRDRKRDQEQPHRHKQARHNGVGQVQEGLTHPEARHTCLPDAVSRSLSPSRLGSGLTARPARLLPISDPVRYYSCSDDKDY